MVKRDVVAARLDKLREYLQTLKAVQKSDLSKFKKDPFIHGAAERYLHLSHNLSAHRADTEAHQAVTG